MKKHGPDRAAWIILALFYHAQQLEAGAMILLLMRELTAGNLAEVAREYWTHQRAFHYLCAEHGKDPERILSLFPGSSKGHGNRKLSALIQAAADLAVGGQVEGEYLNTVIAFYRQFLVDLNRLIAEDIEGEENAEKS